MSDLARRAVACKGWRWLGGEMQLIREHGTWRRYRRVCPTPSVGTIPDLDDPATLGCLLALVREAWGDPSAVTSPDGVTWGVHVASAPEGLTVPGWDTMVAMVDTEAEALVAALEAAP